jgi:broad specificity phosphatase PhoE
MKNTTTIYIVRHGETHGNVRQIITGHYNSRLTEKGKEQAKAVGEKLRNIKFAKIFSSDLTRAKHTAGIIAEINNLEHEINPILREKFFGIYEGKPIPTYWKTTKPQYEIFQKLSKTEKLNFHFHESIESDSEVILRWKQFISKIIKDHMGDNIVVVSHGSFMRALLFHLDFTDYTRSKTEIVENTGFIAIQTDGENFVVKETIGVSKIK